MDSENDSSEKVDEKEESFQAGPLLLTIPVLCMIPGGLVLSQLPWLIGAYNYLRGASSPIDQAALALLGSDSSRLVVILSCIVGAVVGFAVSRVATTKFDMTRMKGESQLGRTYWVLIGGWSLFYLPIDVIRFLYSDSSFLAEIGSFAMAGYVFALAAPLLLKYLQLFLHARSANSHIELVGTSNGSGMRRRIRNMKLRVVRNDFEWW